jgi:hypothetical protein
LARNNGPPIRGEPIPSLDGHEKACGSNARKRGVEFPADHVRHEYALRTARGLNRFLADLLLSSFASTATSENCSRETDADE